MSIVKDDVKDGLPSLLESRYKKTMIMKNIIGKRVCV